MTTPAFRGWIRFTDGKWSCPVSGDDENDVLNRLLDVKQTGIRDRIVLEGSKLPWEQLTKMRRNHR